MGQYAILIVLSALILGGVVLFNAQQKAQGADDDLTEYHEDRFGREIALVGLKRTERLLAKHADLWDLKTSNDPAAQDSFAAPTPVTFTKGTLTGTYQVTYDSYTPKSGATPELATFTSRGVYNGKTYTVQVTYEQGETDIGVPPSMRAAIVTNEDLHIQGSNNVWGSTHSNGATTTQGQAPTIAGQGTYTNGAAPNGNLFSGGVAYQDSIPVPLIAIPPVSGITHSVSGNHNLATGAPSSGGGGNGGGNGGGGKGNGGGNGNGNGGGGGGGGSATIVVPSGWYGVTGVGTQQNPYVLFVDGDLEVGGQVTLQGHVRIYVSGTFRMGSNDILKPTPAATFNANNASQAAIQTWVSSNMPGGTTLAIYADDYDFQGTPFIAAHLYARNPNVSLEYGGGGNGLILGGVTARGGVELGPSNGKIYHVDTNTSILDPGSVYQTPDGIRLAAYREWADRTP